MRIGFACFIVFLTTQVFALDPPAPIKGTPNIMAGKQFTVTAGITSVSFSFPEGWGMGETSASENTGQFTLFPQEGGYGCSIHIDRFFSETLAKEEQDRLRRTFLRSDDISDGFESACKNSWYACRVNGFYLTQMWYCVSKASGQEAVIWQKLKSCVSVSEKKKQEQVHEEKWVALKEVPRKGWICNHPNNQLHVSLKNNIVHSSKSNQDLSKKYLLEIGDMNSTGFFYILWDQQALDTHIPYENHLNTMKADILNMQKGQEFEKDITFESADGFAILNGYPYSLISLSGEGFLFGFALKSKFAYRPFDINDYIKRVGWWKED